MSHAEGVEDRVRRFVPQSLTEAEWAVARESVVSAVLRADPASLEQAKLLASRLCAFLGWLPVEDWDRVNAPDLERVLTSGRVRAFTSSAGMPEASKGTRDSYRVKLTRLAAEVSGVGRLRGIRRVGPPAASRAFWPHVTDVGPFTVLAAAYVRTGAALHIHAWSGLADALAVDLSGLPSRVSVPLDECVGVNAAARRVGTVRGVQAAAAVLRDAHAPAMEVVTANSPSQVGSPAEPTSQKGGRPMSRAAALRAARAARAARLSQPASGTETLEPAVAAGGSLPEPLAGMLVGWAPPDVDAAAWAGIRDAVAAAVTAYLPPSAGALRNCRSIILGYARWLHTRADRTASGDLVPEEFLIDGLVAAYLAGPLGGQPDASRATARSVLRRVVRTLDPGPAPEKIAYNPVQAPYTVAECARFVLLARNQPTDPLRRSLSAMVGLGLGAGLGPEDQRTIAPCHIREVDLGEHGSALVIDVPGPRERSVIVRAQYEPLLRDALGLHAKARRGSKTPLYGVKPDRKNGANRVANQAATATGNGIEVSAARLRSTWLVACMSSPVPLGALLHASGLRTPRTLSDLLPYCPPADPDAVASVLRTMGADREVES